MASIIFGQQKCPVATDIFMIAGCPWGRRQMTLLRRFFVTMMRFSMMRNQVGLRVSLPVIVGRLPSTGLPSIVRSIGLEVESLLRLGAAVFHSQRFQVLVGAVFKKVFFRCEEVLFLTILPTATRWTMNARDYHVSPPCLVNNW